MSRRFAPSLIAIVLAAGAVGSSQAAPSKGKPPKPPGPCTWHGIQIVKRVNVGCPKAQKVVASWYGVAYPDSNGWNCLNDPPDYSAGHCWKGDKKFKFRPPPR